MRRSIPARGEQPAARPARRAQAPAEAIKRLGAAFKPEFEQLGASDIYEGYMAQLLERHKTLRSAAKS